MGKDPSRGSDGDDCLPFIVMDRTEQPSSDNTWFLGHIECGIITNERQGRTTVHRQNKVVDQGIEDASRGGLNYLECFRYFAGTTTKFPENQFAIQQAN